MKTIRLYRHPDCARCAYIAKWHKRFDWFGRLEETTEVPPSGPLKKGQIAVLDLATGICYQGNKAVRRIFAEIPAYLPLRPLLRIRAVQRAIDRDMQVTCGGDACELPWDRAKA